MDGLQWLLELALVGLLGATLFHAIRLERALGVLKRDRAALEQLVAGFNASTRQAESGIDRLRAAADGVGRQIAKHIEQAQTLRDDLAYMTDRGDKLADRLDGVVRHGRALVEAAPRAPHLTLAAAAEPEAETRRQSQAERDLMRALRQAR